MSVPFIHSVNLVVAVSTATILSVSSQVDGAEESIATLLTQLAKSKEPVTRAQSADALGATGDIKAADPLCNALDDTDPKVRAAAAKALGKLAINGSEECLYKHVSDVNRDVRAEVEKAVAGLASTKTARLYIALDVAAKGTSDRIAQMAENELRARLESMGAAIAPHGEAPDLADSQIRSQGYNGFKLNATVEMTPDGALRVAILCLTYPKKVMLGEVSLKATGGDPPTLIRALVPRLLDNAAREFGWSQP